MAEVDNPFHNPGKHPPGDVNLHAWEKADMARRVVQARRTSHATDGRVDLGAEDAEQALRERATDIAQQQYDRMALSEDTQTNLLERTPITTDDQEWLRQKLGKLGDLKPGTPEFYKAHRVQPPDPVMVGYVQGPGEGTAMVQSRVWAVDSDEYSERYDIKPPLMFGKHAGEEMTNKEYRAVRRAMYPVQFDKDGNPTDYTKAHDSRDMPEIVRGVGAKVDLTEATPEEREAAKQYATTGYIPGGTGDPDIEPTEHVIRPDPPREIANPDVGSAG